MLGKKYTKFATKNRATILPTKQARLINDVTAVLLFALALVLGGMLFTYSTDDPCWFRSVELNVVHNKFGFLGSYIADIIFSIFGKSGWWLVVGIFYLGYRKIIRYEINTGNWYSIFQIISFIILVVCSTILEYLILYYTPSTTLHNGNGGLVGKLLFNQIAGNFGFLTTTIVTLFVFVTCFSFAFSLSLLTLAEKIGLVLEYCYSSIFGKKQVEEEVEEIVNSQEDLPVTTKIPVKDDFSNLLDETPEPPQSRFRQSIEERSISPEHAIKKAEASENAIRRTVTPEPIEEEIVENKPIKLERVKPQQKQPVSTGMLPSTSLLNPPAIQPDTISEETLEFVSMSIENKLAEFGVEAKITNAESGPVITRYELLPSRGVRGEKIVALGKEIARGLALTNVRIVETIPGKNSMGIEVPNFKRKIIYL